ncbi:hypothetical protein [Flavobacterium sp. W20_MBD1_R3]|uniref:hypothetical protein n=1 Tax=Flavobacterium sp. W20_MBD1_R3 TaxID=3240278 RepID=UPI003F92EE15
MNNEKLEPLKTKIVFKMNSDILHIHNRQHFDDLNIATIPYDSSQLIRVNQEVIIENNKYKVTEVYFKLEKDTINIRSSSNLEKEQAMSYNSQVVVLLEPLF